MECVICYRPCEYTVKLCKNKNHDVCLICYEQMNKQKSVKCPVCRNEVKIVLPERPQIKQKLYKNLQVPALMRLNRRQCEMEKKSYEFKIRQLQLEFDQLQNDKQWAFALILYKLERYFNDSGSWKDQYQYTHQFQLEFEPTRRIFRHQKKRTQSLTDCDKNGYTLDCFHHKEVKPNWANKKRYTSQDHQFEVDYER